MPTDLKELRGELRKLANDTHGPDGWKSITLVIDPPDAEADAAADVIQVRNLTAAPADTPPDLT